VQTQLLVTLNRFRGNTSNGFIAQTDRQTDGRRDFNWCSEFHKGQAIEYSAGSLNAANCIVSLVYY